MYLVVFLEGHNLTVGTFVHAVDIGHHIQNKGWLGDQHGRSIPAVPAFSRPKHEMVLSQRRRFVASHSETTGTYRQLSRLLLVLLWPRPSDDPYCFVCVPLFVTFCENMCPLQL